MQRCLMLFPVLCSYKRAKDEARISRRAGKGDGGRKNILAVKLQERTNLFSVRSACVVGVPCRATDNCPTDHQQSDPMALIILLISVFFTQRNLYCFLLVAFLYQPHADFDTKNNVNVSSTTIFHNGKWQKQLVKKCSKVFQLFCVRYFSEA